MRRFHLPLSLGFLLAAACSSHEPRSMLYRLGTPVRLCRGQCPDSSTVILEARSDAGALKPGVRAEVGVPGGPDGLDFAAHTPRSVLQIHKQGRDTTEVLLAMRTVGLGDRAFFAITLRNVATGKEVRTPIPEQPSVLACDSGEVVCDLVPIAAVADGLTAKDRDRDGLLISVDVEVHNEIGTQAFTLHEATLSTSEL